MWARLLGWKQNVTMETKLAIKSYAWSSWPKLPNEEMKNTNRWKHLDWGGDCNVSQIKTWNKQKYHIFHCLRFVSSSSAAAGESAISYLSPHNRSGWKHGDMCMLFCQWNADYICATFGWKPANDEETPVMHFPGCRSPASIHSKRNCLLAHESCTDLLTKLLV